MTGFIFEGVISANTYRDVGGTTPWMGEVEPRREQRSSATQDAKAEAQRTRGLNTNNIKSSVFSVANLLILNKGNHHE